MSNFWQLSDGSQFDNSGDFEAGNTLAPIPDGSTLYAAIKEAKWESYEGEEFIKVQWQILKPQEYNNRVVFQKIRVNEKDKTKRDKALRMLNAIDINSGSKLPRDREPADVDLAQCWTRKMMTIKVKVWEQNGNSGNWIVAVSSPRKEATPTPTKPTQPAQLPDMADDNIPF